jgi:hypothetical protein
MVGASAGLTARLRRPPSAAGPAPPYPQWKVRGKPARRSLVSDTRRSALSAALKAERASLAAQSRRIETEATPIRYVAELVGADIDSERAIPSRSWCCAVIR